MLMLFIVLTVVISQLHLLRNLTSMYFLAYFGCFAITIVVAALTLRTVDRESRYLLKIVTVLYLIPCVAIIPGVLSGAPYTASSLGVGLGRLLFTLPIFVVVMLAPRSEANTRTILVTASAITVVAALSIPYQFVTGPVLWFADSSGRAGLIRFASLFGSLTILGIVCGVGILVCAYSFRSAVVFAFALLCIAMGSILSLSKASLVNVAYALIVMPFVRRTTRRQVLVFLVFLVIGLYAVTALFGTELLSFWSSFRLTDVSESTPIDDVSLSASIVDRLTALPMLAVNFHGPSSLLLGVGPIGGAGTFGFAEVVPTVHNGLIELLLLGGLPMFLWYLWVNKVLVTASIAMMKSPGGGRAGLLSVFILANLFVNSAFSTNIMFQPIGALFFAISLRLAVPGVVFARRRKRMREVEINGGRQPSPALGASGGYSSLEDAM